MSTDDLQRQLRLELEVPFARGTSWGTLVIGFYFLALLPMYFSARGGWQAVLASWVTLAAGVVLLAVAFILRKPPTVAGRSERLASLGMAAVMVQVLTNILVGRSWNNTSDLMILMVALAFIVRSGSLFFSMLSVASGSWLLAAAFDHADPQFMHWVLGMLSALLVSLVLHLHLRRMWNFQENLVRRDRERMEEKARLIGELEAALDNVKVLRGLIPICAHCKKVRNDKGYWEQVETYVRQRTEAQFSHGICPDCLPGVREEVEQLKRDPSGPFRNLGR
jgi:hypothetical protein